ncbi:tetratricopeptide repeat protein [Corallibacter sp.]|uniref:tetratricopeptide repeat protein n=1 Tax=Corallibacter sp. TaxID=2038084 RepID=UPI003AB38ACA
MKRLLLLVVLVTAFSVNAQTNQQLLKHYEAFYKQMREQGDIQGMINGLTHLNVLAPSQARKDTLSYIYMSEGKYVQALNTIGIEKNVSDSDMALEVKAVSLKSLGETERAIEQFKVMYDREPNVGAAYELAELYLQTQKLTEANTYIQYGLLNSQDDMAKAFYETQQPYRVPLKAAFLYLKGLVKFNENKTDNIDTAISFLDQALSMAPNFNMANISKNALLSQKQKPAETQNSGENKN